MPPVLDLGSTRRTCTMLLEIFEVRQCEGNNLPCRAGIYAQFGLLDAAPLDHRNLTHGDISLPN